MFTLESGVVVPIPSLLAVFDQKSSLSPDRAVDPVKKVTCPADPDPVNCDPPVHTPSTAKHPVSRLIPLLKEEVPAPWTLIMPEVWMTPAVVVETPTPRPPRMVAWFVTDNPPVPVMETAGAVRPALKVEVALTVKVLVDPSPRVVLP